MSFSKKPIPHKLFKTPPNSLCLLSQIANATWDTVFYKCLYHSRLNIRCFQDIYKIPITSIETYRLQPLRDVVTDPSRIEWIAGAYRGQTSRSVPIAESHKETGTRYDVFKETIQNILTDKRQRTGLAITHSERRYFAAEITTMLGYAGIPTHMFIDKHRQRTYEIINRLKPDILVILTDNIDDQKLPHSIELGITFRRSQKLNRVPQLDIYLVDELGFLGHSTDLINWILYNDLFMFERSMRGNLIVTAFRNTLQPLLRIETHDKIHRLEQYTTQLGDLSAEG